MSLQKHIKDLIFFYIKTNYEKHLTDNNITYIEEKDIEPLINSLYTERKDHIKQFIKSSLRQMLGQEYPGDQMIQNVLINIFQDDELCKNRLIIEIKLHQQQKATGKNDYSKLLSK
jgi:hypothetical protein